MAQPPDEYEVGYGKPPKNNQFAKGRSGNPRGRPKGTKNVATIFHKTALQMVKINENGKARKITKFEAIAMQLTNKAASGDLRATREFMQWHRNFAEAGEQNPLDHPDTQRNQLVMQSFISRIQASSNNSTTSSVTTEEKPTDEGASDES